jgi:hypothetical protein
MQTHFSSCTGVADVKVDRSASKVAVFGKADQSRVLKKLKKVDWRAKAISVDKKKLQQVSLALAPKPCPLCHPSWSIAMGHHYPPDFVSYYPGDFCSHVPPMNIYFMHIKYVAFNIVYTFQLLCVFLGHHLDLSHLFFKQLLVSCPCPLLCLR